MDKQLVCLRVGEMSLTTADTLLQIVWIPAIHQHLLIVIRFKKNCIATQEAVNYIIAGIADIGEDAHYYGCRRHDETVWVGSVMLFWKSVYRKAAYFHRLKGVE